MQFVPIDLAEIVAIVLGISIILIPVLGLTARFALKPTVEALGRFFEAKGTDETLEVLERRIALLEHQIEGLESTVRRLDEAAEFQERLRSGGGDE